MATSAPHLPLRSFTRIGVAKTRGKWGTIHTVARWMLRYLGNTVLLSRGDFVLGRGSDCGLQIDDVEASRRHAVLHVENDSVTIEDLGSRNGLRLNGVRIEGTRPLGHGDVITIGKYEIHLIEEDERQRRAILTTVQSSGDSERLSDELVSALDLETGEVPSLAGVDKLSKREQEVLRLVALGHTHKEIAKTLGVSVKTIETYRSRINDKLGFESRAELVRFALRAGLMDE
jgi:pSer/pThr/pTyr-binding forkhead associated (FHA) protein